MKVRVLKKFRDKVTKEIRKTGDVFEATEERVEEIMKKSKDLVEVVKENPEQGEEPDKGEVGEEPDKEPEQDGEQEQGENQEAAGAVCDIAQMTEEQLRELAKSRKIKGYTKMSVEEIKEALEQ